VFIFIFIKKNKLLI